MLQKCEFYSSLCLDCERNISKIDKRDYNQYFLSGKWWVVSDVENGKYVGSSVLETSGLVVVHNAPNC